MAIVIDGTVVVDESSGTQNAADGSPADASGNDVAFGNLPDAFEDILGVNLGLNTGAATTNVAVSGGTADNSTGTAMITGLPVGYTDIGWTNVGGAPLNGADSGLDTTDGTSILLYTYSGDNNVLLGRAGGETGDVVFAAYLEEINGTQAKVWLVQFASMFNDVNPNPDDPVNPLQNVMYIGVSQTLQFSLKDAPSGSNLFLMFGTPGDGDATNGDEVSLVVTATNAPTGGVVSSQGGGGTTLGVNNQMLDPGEGLTFTFVTNSVSDFTVPNLSETEADVEANIQFGGVLQDATSASFLVVQNQPSSKSSTLTLTAYLTDAESGVGFIAGYADDTPVNISSVTVTNADVTVTDNGDGTFTLVGLKAGDEVTYVTASEHNRVTIEDTGVKNTSTGAAFDIGDFQVITPVVLPFEFHQMEFQDAGPTLAFGNLVGTGSALAQTGFWSMDAGADGLDTSQGNNGLDLVLNWFSLDGGTTQVAPTLFQSDGVDLDGNFLFSGTLTGDFDKNSGTDPTDIDFTFLADPSDGHYELTVAGGFGSVIDFDTADGQLRAGGPDAVQTLDIPPPPNTEISIVFFSAEALADAGDISSGLDQTEHDLETGSPPPSYIDFARGMNVSTSGIGVSNNLLEGTGTTAGVGGITAADESFVIDPNEPVSSMTIFVDNSVGGYAFTATGDKHEELYYRVYYEDGTFSPGLILVDENLGLPNKGQATSFFIDGGDKEIDAVQLTMNQGAVKIPHILLSQETTSLASDILLDFTATIHDADGLSGGDPATSDFSVDLQTNELSGSDFVLAGTTGEADAFNIDLASDLNTYEVTGFELGTDIFVLIGDATATIGVTDDGVDSTVTINETDPAALDTTITVTGVVGLDATTDFVFG